jgi:hypothetical protein
MVFSDIKILLNVKIAYFLCDLCEKLCGLCGSGFGLNKVTESMLFT